MMKLSEVVAALAPRWAVTMVPKKGRDGGFTGSWTWVAVAANPDSPYHKNPVRANTGTDLVYACRGTERRAA